MISGLHSHLLSYNYLLPCSVDQWLRGGNHLDWFSRSGLSAYASDGVTSLAI